MHSVRDLIEEMRREVRDTDLQPARAAEILTKLTALLGNVLQEIREADMEFNKVLLAHLDTGEPANRARIKAEVSPEFMRRREARDTHAVLLEIIRSLRQVLRTQAEEMRLAR